MNLFLGGQFSLYFPGHPYVTTLMSFYVTNIHFESQLVANPISLTSLRKYVLLPKYYLPIKCLLLWR
jgi:hypothetical protein